MSHDVGAQVGRRAATAIPWILTVILPAAVALANDGKHMIRFGAQYVSPTGNAIASDDEFEVTFNPLDAFGPWIAYERMVTERIGIEPMVSFQTHEIEAVVLELATNQQDSAELGDLDMVPFVVGGNYHFPASTGSDLYVGVQLAYVTFGDLELRDSPETIALKDGFGFGAVVGVDVPIGEGPWGIHAHLQYLDVPAEVDEPGSDVTIDIDPFVVAVGVHRRF